MRQWKVHPIPCHWEKKKKQSFHITTPQQRRSGNGKEKFQKRERESRRKEYSPFSSSTTRKQAFISNPMGDPHKNPAEKKGESISAKGERHTAKKKRAKKKRERKKTLHHTDREGKTVGAYTIPLTRGKVGSEETLRGGNRKGPPSTKKTKGQQRQILRDAPEIQTHHKGGGKTIGGKKKERVSQMVGKLSHASCPKLQGRAQPLKRLH